CVFGGVAARTRRRHRDLHVLGRRRRPERIGCRLSAATALDDGARELRRNWGWVSGPRARSASRSSLLGRSCASRSRRERGPSAPRAFFGRQTVGARRPRENCCGTLGVEPKHGEVDPSGPMLRGHAARVCTGFGRAALARWGLEAFSALIGQGKRRRIGRMANGIRALLRPVLQTWPKGQLVSGLTLGLDIFGQGPGELAKGDVKAAKLILHGAFLNSAREEA